MGERARVLSVDALRDVKAALIEFTDSVGVTLAGVDADINRVNHWLTHDRPGHWKREVRKREEEVAEAQTAIMRKKIIAAPESASIVEEQKMLQRAKARLMDAQVKLGNVKRWAPTFEREALLYKGSCRGLTEMLHRDIPVATQRLERMMAALEGYARLAPPRGDLDAAPPPESGESAEGGPETRNDPSGRLDLPPGTDPDRDGPEVAP